MYTQYSRFSRVTPRGLTHIHPTAMPLRRPQQLANPSPSSNLAAAPASRMAEPPSAARCSTRGRHLTPHQPIAYVVAAQAQPRSPPPCCCRRPKHVPAARNTHHPQPQPPRPDHRHHGGRETALGGAHKHPWRPPALLSRSRAAPPPPSPDPPGHRNTCRQHPRRSAGTRAGCGRTQHMAPDCLGREMAAQRRQCRPGPARHPQQAPGTKVSDSSSTARVTVVTRQCVPVGAHCARSGPMAPCQHTGAAGAAPAPPA